MTGRRERRRPIGSWLLVLATAGVVWAGAGSASAQPTDRKAEAEARFRAGKARMKQGDLHQACADLAESFRLDPATGTLLALAICHQKEGKTASAFAEYGDVAARATSEGRVDRAHAAERWRAALATTLSTLAIDVPPRVASTRGLRIMRDDLPVEAPAWKKAAPVDPGPHVVVATAPGKIAWRQTVVVQDAAHETVTVAALASIAPPAPPDQPPPPPPSPAPPAAARSRPPLAPLATAGLITAGAGLVSIGVGAFFGVDALRKNEQSKSGCDGDLCNPDGKRLRLAALSSGNLSTAGFAIGAALLGGGLAMYWWGGGRASDGTADGANVRVSAAFDGRAGWGLRIESTFGGF